MPSAIPSMLTLENFAVSPCSTPSLTLEEALAALSRLGYRKFEMFSGWCKSHADIEADPQIYLDLAKSHGMRYTSMHLPPVEDDRDATIDRAIRAARFAHAIGASVVLYKGTSRENYIAGAARFLDGIEGLGITPVVQNHVGTPVTTPQDFQAVMEGIDDPRMKTLLEVGMFHSIGVSWHEGYDLLGDSIALVHIKDQVGEKRVPFGEGEVDLKGLFAHLQQVGYAGEIVIEMEVCRDDIERTLRLLGEARTHCGRLLKEI